MAMFTFLFHMKAMVLNTKIHVFWSNPVLLPFESRHMIDFNAINDYNAIIFNPNPTFMASLTIRNLEEDIKHRLRIRAAERGRSMEEEAREILRMAVSAPFPARNLAASMRARLSSEQRAELEIPAREPMRLASLSESGHR